MTGTIIIIHMDKGYDTIVDAADYPLVAPYTWCVKINPRGLLHTQAWVPEIKGYSSVHRMLLGVRRGHQIDHIDGNGLNNRRSNLRFATQSQNNGNRAPRKGFRFKGIRQDTRRGEGRWRAQIGLNNHVVGLGSYDTAEEAARAYDDAALEVFGEFARLNFPERRV